MNCDSVATELLKLNLGCGDMILDGYVNIDLYSSYADVNHDVRFLGIYEDNTVDEIYASHIIEHFDFNEGIAALKEWWRVLKPLGRIVIEAPDFLGLCHRFINSNEKGRIGLYNHIFGGLQIGHGHKFMYTPVQMKWTLEQCKFVKIKRISQTRFPGGDDINMAWEAFKPSIDEVNKT